MRAAWYVRRGPAREVLVVGDMPDPQPGPGEVRIAVTTSGLNPGDVKKRSGWSGQEMPYPRVIPHSDGAGTIDAVGSGVTPDRVGQRVWCYGAQSYRAFGTAAEYVVVPTSLAVPLPSIDGPTDDLDVQAACLGIAGITAHRALFADGPLHGKAVLVYGAAGGVGSIATQLARRSAAVVLAVVRDDDQIERARRAGASHAFVESDPGLVDLIRSAAPDGVHRIAEVDLARHADIDAAVLAIGGVVSSYYSSQAATSIPYWSFGFKDATLRLLGSDDFRPEVKAEAARELTDALAAGDLHSDISAVLPLGDIADAHERVEQGVRGRVVIEVRS